MKINGGQPVLIRHFSENLPIDYLTISNLWKIIFWLNLQWSRCVAESVGEMAKSPTHRPHSAHTVKYPLKNRPHIAHTIKNAHTPPTPSTCGKKRNILGKNVFWHYLDLIFRSRYLWNVWNGYPKKYFSKS